MEVLPVVVDHFAGPRLPHETERFVEHERTCRLVSPRTPTALSGRRRRDRTPAGSVRPTGRRETRAPWRARPDCDPAATSTLVPSLSRLVRPAANASPTSGSVEGPPRRSGKPQRVEAELFQAVDEPAEPFRRGAGMTDSGAVADSHLHPRSIAAEGQKSHRRSCLTEVGRRHWHWSACRYRVPRNVPISPRSSSSIYELEDDAVDGTRAGLHGVKDPGTIESGLPRSSQYDERPPSPR